MIGIILWVAIVSFCVGRWTVQRETAHRMGQKIIQTMENTLEIRKVAGKEVTIDEVTKWKSEGYDWELSVKQLGKVS